MSKELTLAGRNGRDERAADAHVPDVSDCDNREALDRYEAAGYCGARKKKPREGVKRASPERCTRPAGWGTEHGGQGRCKYHGGRSPIKSGRYSRIERERIRDLYEEYAEDPDPLNLLPELAMLRTLATDYINRYDEDKESRELWWAAVTQKRADDPEVRAAVRVVLEGANPQKPMDLSEAWRLVSEVTKAAKRIEDIRAQNAISRADLFRVLREMGKTVRRHNEVADPAERLKKIEDDWQRIAL